MHYNLLSENELGFDAFIAPDDFDHANSRQYSGDHPVDIYEIFKREYALNSHARYIYYYSPGNYPLTLTPTATEYYRYGYTNALNQEVIVDVPLNGSPVTIWGNNITTPLNTSGGDESGYTKRWVVVCRPSTEKFSLMFSVIMAIWIYCGDKINEIKGTGLLLQLKYIHFANLNSLTGVFDGAFFTSNAQKFYLQGTINIPETVTQINSGSFRDVIFASEVNMPNTKDVSINHQTIGQYYTFHKPSKIEFNLGASTSVGTELDRSEYVNLSNISVSPQNTAYASFNNCDIIYTKALTAIIWIAAKTVRGLYIPDQLPQSEIGTTGTGISTKLSTNIMQGYPLHIGSLITDLTNLYLSNKSFTTITVGAGNTAFLVENNILFNANKTTLVKAGSVSPGNLTIPTSLTSVSPNAFLRYSHTGSIPLIFSGAGQFNLSNYNNFQFATFTGQSLSDIITNEKLLPGAANSPKYFIINQASLDALNVYNSNAVNIALTQQYIDIITPPQGSLLNLDASESNSYSGSGATWYDLSGNNNHGTIIGATYNSTNGGVMSFDGVNDKIEKTNFTNLTDPIFSISMWIFRKADFIYKGCWRIGSPNSNNIGNYCDNTRPNRIGFSLIGAQRYYTSEIYPLNSWVHVTWVKYGSGFNTNSLKIYINGVEYAITQYVAGTSVPNIASGYTLGTASYTDYANLLINDVLYYDKAISSIEINSLFKSKKSKYGL